MSDATLHPARAFRAATQEAPLLRAALIGIAVAGLAVLVFAPLAVVFAEALKDGWLAAVESLGNRDARSAIQLTLLITAIAVPLNAVFGIAAAWAITKFDFRGKAFLITLIDLPFSVSPVVAGLCIVLLFGANSAIGGWLVANGWPIVFAIPGIGRLALDAVSQRDYPVVQGTTLFIAAAFVFMNLVTDVIYGFVDPRIRVK